MEGIVQREINRFMLESFGRFLRPNILEAIRREVNPAFQESDLTSVIQSMLGGCGPPESRSEPPVAAELRANRDPHAREIPSAPSLENRESAGSPLFIEGDSAGLPDPGDSPVSTVAPTTGDASESQDHIESLIRIIMDATGFTGTRSNPIWISEGTSPSDPAVSRSSWTPRSANFGITIELEDFIHVRTVKDIAQRISEIIARQEGAGLAAGHQGC